jgi:DNA-binding response OmpR family regulator
MRKILVVEDEDLLREAYLDVLSTEPYQIDTAADGKQALNKCRETKYDLILLDLMMPVVNGVEFLEYYIQEGLSPKRVLILSNLSSGKELNKAMELGAYKNLLKANISPKQLLSTVRYELEAA